MNLWDVRIGTETYPPELFKENGLRGWWVRVLNAIRVRVELRCEYHAALLIDMPRTKELPLDALTQSETSSIQPLPAHLKDTSLNRYIATGRARRYARGRRTFSVFNNEAATYERSESEVGESESATGSTESRTEGQQGA